MMPVKAQQSIGLAKRAAREFREYVIVAAYLYVCFGAIILYKTSVLRSHNIDYAPYGTAAIKAFILAKFMLIGHAANIGGRVYRNRPLAYPIIFQSLVFLVMLIVLSAAEEVVTGAIHGRTVLESVRGMAGGTWLQIGAVCLLLWLVLLPYFAFRQLGDLLGEGNLRRMFFVDPVNPESAGRRRSSGADHDKG